MFTLETGAGVPGANAYASVAFVTQYLTDRGRQAENNWASSGLLGQQRAIVSGTDYIETRWGPHFRGSRLRQYVEGREASGLLTFSGLPANLETLTVGQKVYRLVTVLVQENDVLIGASIAETVAALADAITAPSGLDVTVEEHTQLNYEAFAIDQNPSLAVAARVRGESGNQIAFSETITNATITAGGFLRDGLDGGEQPLSFPRYGLYSRDYVSVSGIPLKLKQATAEYAVRAIAAPLSPDPSFDDRFASVRRFTEIVGPIEETTEYSNSFRQITLKPYPAADQLLSEFVYTGGGVIRG